MQNLKRKETQILEDSTSRDMERRAGRTEGGPLFKQCTPRNSGARSTGQVARARTITCQKPYLRLRKFPSLLAVGRGAAACCCGALPCETERGSTAVQISAGIRPRVGSIVSSPEVNARSDVKEMCIVYLGKRIVEEEEGRINVIAVVVEKLPRQGKWQQLKPKAVSGRAPPHSSGCPPRVPGLDDVRGLPAPSATRWG
jgi:hypothetical protein